MTQSLGGGNYAQRKHDATTRLRERLNELEKDTNQKLKEVEQDMTAEISGIVTTEYFPERMISSRFMKALPQAFDHETAQGARVDQGYFEKMVTTILAKKAHELTLAEMGVAINCVESKSKAQYGFKLWDQYWELQREVKVMGEEWNVIVTAIKEPIIEKYRAMAEEIKQAANKEKQTAERMAQLTIH